jgi:vancomycin resistance protein YoaR
MSTDLRPGLSDRPMRPWPMWARLVPWLGTLTLVLAVGVIGGLLVLDHTYSGRIIPNVAVQGLALDGLRPDEARTRLGQRYAAFLATPVTLQFANRTWRPTLAQLGITVELDEAAEHAYTIGRGADLFANASEALAIWQDGVDLPIRLTVDRRQLQIYLTTLAPEIEIAPTNAHLSVLKGRVASAPERIGRQVLVDQTADDLLADLPTLAPQTVRIRVRELRPLVEDSSIAEAQRQLSRLLQGPVMLTAGEQSWTWTPEALGDLVQLTRAPRADGPGQQVVATLDRQSMEDQLRTMAETIDTAAVEPRLRFTSEGLQIITPGQEGAQLEVAQALDQLAAGLWQDQREISLPVSVLQPQARPETLANLGIVELVAQGKSSFENSAPYRVTNIQAGARQMDGVLIAPGAEFSFNQTVGAIDESNGFTQGYAIIDGRTQLEWGGGVCQVSTTVFRAAFWAGVPITERNQHSFRISWYEQFEPIGMDAAIFTGPGGYDLRFVNDTNTWLLMETVADTANEVLIVNLYGTRPDREVIQTPPAITNEVAAPAQPRYIEDPALPAGTVKQTDTARGGMDVRVGRIVRQGEQVLYEDTFFSRFQSWPDIFVRGIG